jgi:hypothetical protein
MKWSFLFVKLHSNAGAHLRAKINLLPSHLLPLSNIDPRGQNNTIDLLLQNGPTPISNCENSGEFDGHLQDTGKETGENLAGIATEDDPAQEFPAKSSMPVGSASGSPCQPVPAQGSEFMTNSMPT